MNFSTMAKPSVAIAALSLTMTGCVTTQGNDTYVNGKCVTCWQNPLTVETPNSRGSTTDSLTSAEGVTLSCRRANSKYDQTWHFRDKRWCDNTTLPGASLSSSVTYSETVALPVDMAYSKAKRFLRFTDPDDNRGDSPFAARRWDGVPGTYYNVVAMYGGLCVRCCGMPNMMFSLKKYPVAAPRSACGIASTAVTWTPLIFVSS